MFSNSPPKKYTKCHLRRQIKSEDDRLVPMDEGRKRVLLIAAAILAARKLSQYEGGLYLFEHLTATIAEATPLYELCASVLE